MTIDEFLQKTGARWLYHFTDIDNVSSIREHGLLSLKELRNRKITPPMPGGNKISRNLDQLRGLDAYVHLCFKNKHQMEYEAKQDGRIQKSIFLRISIEVLRIPGVMGCPIVANRNDAIGQVTPLEDALDHIDLDVLYGPPFDFRDPSNLERRNRFNAAKLSEVLIPSAIPTNLIYDLH